MSASPQRRRRKPRTSQTLDPQHRIQLVPSITYPDLPVSERVHDIVHALNSHQVVVVAGETGSGKTTQLPKICLEAGRGIHGMIAHTQPRRIAARTVAERIAHELDVPLGAQVGYSVRFTDESTPDTLIRLMTDGLLLAQITDDPLLRQYDTIIVDEAHERSLNIDFLLGYLTQLLPQRPDLRVIITSATIDTQRFSQHFNNAPIIEVSGRSYPIDIRYRPLYEPNALDDNVSEPLDQTTGIVRATHEAAAEGDGDILIFVSGEREIRDTIDALTGAVATLKGPPAHVVPLFGRLSMNEQREIFAPHAGRRVVVATNVAETSVTVPGIRYVIDAGTARISRYSTRTKIQRLPIEPISQAAANQRAGRCGRVAHGVCIRLYDETDFASRPEFTEPEILRTNLASVILSMESLRLGDVDTFPFLQPPDTRQVKDGVTTLTELGALAPQKKPGDRLTRVGRLMSRLPLDPRLSRMVVAAADRGCLTDVIVLTAALTIQDPRDRPEKHQAAADQAHARFVDPTSDFGTWLRLWAYIQEQQEVLSSSAFRKLCRKEYLNWLRIREWQDLVSQVRRTTKNARLMPRGSTNSSTYTPAPPQAIHEAVLTGIAPNIGSWDERKRDYQSTRGTRYIIRPGSSSHRKNPPLVVAEELVDTNRVWAGNVAQVKPEWVEAAVPHLLNRSYSAPRWNKRKGAVIANEKVTLLGVTIVAHRSVMYSTIDPTLSRELFIRGALVERDLKPNTRRPEYAFWSHNADVLDEIEHLRAKTRQSQLVVDDQRLFDFFDQRVPDNVYSLRHFERWWKKRRREEPNLLNFSLESLTAASADSLDAERFPTQWSVGDFDVDLSYHFEPGHYADGVTMSVPIHALDAPEVKSLAAEPLAWHVPGLRHELLTALIKSLPKSIRKHYVPAPDTALILLDDLANLAPSESLTAALAAALTRRGPAVVSPPDFDLGRVPDHLRVRFEVIDGTAPIAASDDLNELTATALPTIEEQLKAATVDYRQAGLTTWPELPDSDDDRIVTSLTVASPTGTLTGYPTLRDHNDTVDLDVTVDKSAQPFLMRAGVIRLLSLTVPRLADHVTGRLDTRSTLMLSASPYENSKALLDDCADAAIGHVVDTTGTPRMRSEYDAAVRRVSADVDDALGLTVQGVVAVLTASGELSTATSSMTSSHPGVLHAASHIEQYHQSLVHDGFVSQIGTSHLVDLQRWLRGQQRRAERATSEPERDERLRHEVHDIVERFAHLSDSRPYDLNPHSQVYRMFHEYLMVHYDPTSRPRMKTSAQRVTKLLNEIEARD